MRGQGFLGVRRYSRVLVKEHIRPKSTDRILEIGCGPGTLAPFLPTTDYVGFDANPEYIKLAQRRFPGLQFVCERVSEYTLAERGSFDIVLAFGILHHLDDAEAVQLFRIAHDALKPGGRLVTHDGVWTSNQSGIAKYLLARDRGQFVRLVSITWHWPRKSSQRLGIRSAMTCYGFHTHIFS